MSGTDAFAGLRVAVVHEWVDAYAGSEQVFEAIAKLFPQADLFALSVAPGVQLDLGGRPVTTTLLDHPRLRDRRGLTLPLMPLAWWLLGRRDYDLVITSHHAFAHCNRLARRGGRHVAYVHSPARYVWTPEIDERGAAWWLAPVRALLKWVDRRASRRVDAYAANSSAVAERIQRFWQREATVIFPPVRVEYFGEPVAAEPTRDYVLGFGRWIPYKNLHLVIEAADLAGLPVTIAGRGPDRSRIDAAAAAASVPVRIVESPTDEQLRELYRNARCLVFPTVEDFGIVPVEAQAAGCPVIAPADGGALDTVLDGRTGVLLPDLDATDIARAIPCTDDVSRAATTAHAQSFGADHAHAALTAWVAAASQSRA